MARGRRGRAAVEAAITRDIDRASSDRRGALAEGRRNDVARLSADLNGRDHFLRPEGLYARLRDTRKGEIPERGRRAPALPEEGGGMAR
jgi:hypothetical protein